MSPEQSMTPNFEQPAAQSAADFEGNDQIDLHKSKLPSMEELRARADIEEATRIMSSTAAEAVNVTPEKLQPQELIGRYATAVLALRRGYELEHFDLLNDDTQPTNNIFNTPKPDTTGLTQNDFDLTA